jgi:hypothetical protein
MAPETVGFFHIPKTGDCRWNSQPIEIIELKISGTLHACILRKVLA